MTYFGRFLTNTDVESLKGCFLEVSTLLNFTPPIVDLSMIAALSHKLLKSAKQISAKTSFSDFCTVVFVGVTPYSARVFSSSS